MIPNIRNAANNIVNNVVNKVVTNVATKIAVQVVCLLIAVCCGFIGVTKLYSADGRVEFVTPQADRMWVGKQTIELRLPEHQAAVVRVVELYLDGRLIKEFNAPPYRLVYDFGSRGENRVLKAVVRGEHLKPLATGQCVSFQVDDTQNVTVMRVMVPVVVTTKSGNYVRGLTRDDFSLTVDGKPMVVTDISSDGAEQFNLVQIIDISYSMRYKIRDVMMASREFIHNLMSPNDRGTFIFFNHSVFEHKGLTGDLKELATRTFLEAPPEGKTALYDAVAMAVNLVNRYSGWNIIVLFSDGGDNSSYIDTYSLLNKIKKTNAVIYAIDNSGDTGGKMLETICSTTGGMTFPLDNVKKTGKIYQKIRADIKAQYLLFFNGDSAGVKKGVKRFHHITIKVNNRDFKVRTIKGFFSKDSL